MQIRQLQAEDLAAWLPLWQAYLRFFNTEISDETTRTTWSRLVDPKEPMFALGAFLEERLVGIAHMVYHRSCWTIGDYCYLQDLFTVPEARGQGVATALIEAVFARARADGVSRVHWLTHESNTAAQSLYDKIAVRSGFIQYRKVLSL
jgi:GNAT superfamily N-acetyltransferase